MGIDAEEVADGVLVFDAVEASQGDGACGGGPGDGGGDGFESLFCMGGIWAWLLFGRHVAELDGFGDFYPGVFGFVGGCGEGEVIEAEFSLLFVWAVAFVAVLFEERLDWG